MKKLVLKKDKILALAKNRQKGLVAFIESEKAELAAAPEGALRIIKNKNTTQYYQKTEDATHNGKYISKKNQLLIQKLAQKDYDSIVLEKAENQLQILNKFLAEYENEQIEEVYDNLSEIRKNLVTPSHIPSEQWIQNWLSAKYGSLGFNENAPEFYTTKGLRVRSKSEILIADALDRLKVPFRYEYPIKLKNFTAHPDFYCLNVDTCEEVVWEHFGLMDDAEYSSKTVNKIAEYEKKGYFPGKNLILTFENAETPLNAKAVEQIIKEYLL